MYKKKMSLEHNYNNIIKYEDINKGEDKSGDRYEDRCNI